MKKAIFILALFFGFTQFSNAKRIKGYYILKSNDTVKVTFNVPIKLITREPNFRRLQLKIKYYTGFGKNKEAVNPREISEVGFYYDGQNFKLQPCRNNLKLAKSSLEWIFLQLDREGKLKLLIYIHSFWHWGGVLNTSETYILQKGDGDLFMPRIVFFRKGMVEYLSDCPEIAKKIDERVYDAGDIQKIVYEYNKSTCK
jgi:hypothetical protein